MKDDLQLKKDVLAELAWDPAVTGAELEVSVHGGIVHVAGAVRSCGQQGALDTAVRRVSGVRGLVMDVRVKLEARGQRSDTEIAKAAVDALHWHSWVPDERIQVAVDDAWVTLTGEVDWHHQVAGAEQCIRTLAGVRGVTNGIVVKPRVAGQDVSGQILAALTRQARRQANRVGVEVDGAVVTLSGEVDSLADHDAAVAAAWRTRGVAKVIDRLAVAGR